MTEFVDVKSQNDWFALATVDYINIFKSKSNQKRSEEDRFVVVKGCIWVDNEKKDGFIMKVVTMQGLLTEPVYKVMIIE